MAIGRAFRISEMPGFLARRFTKTLNSRRQEKDVLVLCGKLVINS